LNHNQEDKADTLDKMFSVSMKKFTLSDTHKEGMENMFSQKRRMS
jgi:hypothetical protein